MTFHVDEERLARLLGQPDLERLIEKLRRRFELGGDSRGTITLSRTTDAERRAIEQLLGRAPSGGTSVQIRLETLEQMLRNAEIAPDLYSAVENLSGTLVDRRAVAAGEQAAWEAVFERTGERAAALGLSEWLAELQATGLLKRLTRNDPLQAAALLDQALETASRLPCRGLTLSALAASALGDAHALDRGRPLATLVKKAAARIGRTEEDDSPETDRAIWAGVGVLVGGDLTSTVLFLNLPGDERTTTGRLLRLLREAGQPGWLTLRQLLRDPPDWRIGEQTVYVCENPAVVAEAAERLGTRCAPLVCTHGQPGAAVTTLLHRLRDAGAALAYHGDFDWPGIRIGNGMIARLGARPWCFDASAYRSACAKGNPLVGTPISACWDSDLMPVMRARNRQVEEEQVLDSLLQDLADTV